MRYVAFAQIAYTRAVQSSVTAAWMVAVQPWGSVATGFVACTDGPAVIVPGASCTSSTPPASTFLPPGQEAVVVTEVRRPVVTVGLSV